MNRRIINEVFLELTVKTIYIKVYITGIKQTAANMTRFENFESL